MTSVRYPIAQDFYPGDLIAQIKGFLAGFTIPIGLPEKISGMILPHAGWQYSGKTAARTIYCTSQTKTPDTCLIFGADHAGVAKHSLYPTGSWKTPLGDIQVNTELANDISKSVNHLMVENSIAHQTEHSIEVLLPMIKYFWPETTIIPIIVKPTKDSLELGYAIGTLLRKSKKEVIGIASTDLTHYGLMYGTVLHEIGVKGFRWMTQNDQQMIQHFITCNSKKVLTEAQKNSNACGAGAVAALLAMMQKLGKDTGHLIDYTTSHGLNPPEKFTCGVGYAGVVY
ncbi:MAG: AmmeMemoRadiSam system protein B [Gammaproteobacteria bacterium]|nr:AmmeMemoRadiSam system protein B [Gammaproteobacteria bacterium]